MGSGAIKWHVHCSVCGAFIEKSAQSDSEVECKKCRSTLEIFVKDDMVSVRPIHIRDEQLKSRMRTYSRKMMNQEPGKTFTDTLQDQKYFLVLEIVEVFVLSGFFDVFRQILNFFVVPHCKTGSQRFVI